MPRCSLKSVQQQAQEMGLQVEFGNKYYKLIVQNHDTSVIPTNIKLELKTKKFYSPKSIQDYLHQLQNNISFHQKREAAIHQSAQVCWKEIKELYSTIDEQRIYDFMEAVLKQVRSFQQEQKNATYKAEQDLCEIKKEEWIKQQGLLTKKQIMQQWQLIHESQFYAAVNLKWIKELLWLSFPNECLPSFMRHSATWSGYYKISINIPEIDYQQLNELSLLTRLQAAEFLKFTPKEFDKFRKKYNLPVADTRMSSGLGSNFRQYNLYRLSDILKLQKDQ